MRKFNLSIFILELSILIFCSLLSLVVFYPETANAMDDEWTIYNTKENYNRAKYEPVEGIYLGAYVLQDVSINYDMDIFNTMMDKKHAIFFKYVGYGNPFPAEWVEQVKAVDGIPHIAWEPNSGLDSVKDDSYLHQFARDMQSTDIPVFIRFASEMNGTWCKYSGDPEMYKKKWRLVHDVLEEESPKAIMLWSVFTFPERTILDYYPGDEYVDWVGINIYNVVYHNNNIAEGATGEDPLRLLDYVYDEFSSSKPIYISEYGVTHYSLTDKEYHIDYAVNKLTRLYSGLITKYPRVKAISYFDVNTLACAPKDRKINNYSITNQAKITEAYKTLVKSDKYLSKIQDCPGALFSETLSFNYRYFIYRDQLYVDKDFFTNNLGIKTKSCSSDQLVLTDGRKDYRVAIIKRSKSKSFYDQNYMIQGLPLRDVCEYFDYSIVLDYNNKSIVIV